MKDFCWNEKGVWGDRSCTGLQEHGHCRDCATFSQEGRTLLDREAPGNYLVEWVSLLAQEREAVSREGSSVQVFRLMSEWLALPARCWVEIVAVRPVRHIPHRSNRILMGLVSVRGETHLCVSLANLLGIEQAERPDDPGARGAALRFCMVKRDNGGWIFPADEVHGLVSYSERDVEGVPSTVAKSFQKFTRGLLNIAGRKVGLLDETAVFDALSRSVL